MSTDTGLQSIQLAAHGLNLKVDPTMLPPGALTRADNVIYTSDGSVRKRYGTIAAVNPTTSPIQLGSATALFSTREGNVGYLTTTKAGRSLSAALSATTTQPIYGRTPSIPFYTSLQGALIPPSNVSVLVNGTQVYLLWDYDTDYVGGSATHKRIAYYGIWDMSTSMWVVAPTQAVMNATFTADVGVGTVVGMGQPVFLASNAVAFSVQFTFGGSSYTQIAVAGFSAAGFSSTWTKIYASGVGPLAGGIYPLPSICPVPEANMDGYWIFIWATSSFSAGALLDTSGANPTVQNTFSLFSSGAHASSPVAARFQDAAHRFLFVADCTYVDLVDTSQAVMSPVTYSIVGASMAGTSWGGLSATQVCGSDTSAGIFYLAQPRSNGAWYYQTYTAAYNPTLQCYVVSSSGATLVSQFQNANQLTPASHIFKTPGGMAFWAVYTGNITGSNQKTLLMVTLTSGQVLARAAYLSANSVLGLPQVANGYLDDGVARTMTFAFLSGGTLIYNGGSLSFSYIPAQLPSPQVTIVQFSWGATQTQELPFGTLTSGLAPTFLTDKDAYELGFSYYPELTASMLSTRGVTTGYIQAGVHQYMVAYQWIDEYNQVHWSAPSAPVSITTAANDAVNLPALPSPTKGIPYWFRTTAGGSTFYQLGAAAGGAAIDFASDTDISNNSFIYTTGGEVSNDPPPSAALMTGTNLRAYAVSSENPTQLFYSKPYRVGHPVEWSAAQYLFVAPQTGPITALGVIDDKLIIFKARNAYLLSGDTGSVTAPQFYGPSPIAVLSGCTNPKSLATTDLGLFYQSARGIDLLQRDLTTQYVGLPIDGNVGSIQAVSINAQLAQIRFLDTAAGCVWNLDLSVSRWSKFTYGMGIASTSLMTGTPAAMYLLTSAGLLQESASVFVDFYNTISQPTYTYMPAVETGHISIATPPQNWGRLRRLALLGTAKNAGTIASTLQIAYDYGGYVDTLPMSGAPGAGMPLQFRSRVPRQRMEAVRFLLTWPAASSQEDMQAQAIALEIAPKAGVYKLPAAQSV